MSAPAVNVWSGAAVTDPAGLRAGHDLVVAPLIGHGLTLPHGTLATDGLGQPERAEVDAWARRLFRSWEGGGPRVDGVSLGWLHEAELLARVFQPAAALATALRTAPASRVVAHGFDAVDAAMVAAACALAGVEHLAGDGTAQEVVYLRGRPSTAARAARTVLDRTGLAPRVRGDVVCAQYWHLLPVFDALLGTGRAATPIGVAVPGVGARAALSIAARAGWTGLPSARRRGAAGAVVRRALPPASTPIGAAAQALLAEQAPATVADLAGFRRGFARGRPRLLLLPWDSPSIARAAIAAGREVGATTLVVQHGFDAQLGDPDKQTAEHLALWSEADRDVIAPRPVEVTVTGNPGAEHLARAPAPVSVATDGPVVVIVEYAGRLSATVDDRVSLTHVATALEGIARARPGARALVRPHPADATRAAYAELAHAHPGLRVVVDGETPIETLLRDASACVAGVSTATLQAALLGVPVVALDVGGARRPAPFDGSGPVPHVTNAERLAEVLGARMGSNEAVRACAAEALGARPGAVDAVMERVRALSAG